MTEECKEKEPEDSPKRNGIVICLASLIIAFLLGLLSLFIYFAIFKYAGKKPCTLEECAESSDIIKEFINTSINPCDDFHEFVCGRFMKNVSENKISNPLQDETLKFEEQFNALITEPLSSNDWDPVILQKKFFQYCLNVKEMDKDEDVTLFGLMGEVSEWPLLTHDMVERNSYDWIKVMIKSKELGLPSNWFFTLDLHDGDQYELEISYSKVCNLDEYDAKKYRNMIIEIMTNVSESKKNYMLESQINKIIKFERQLHKICVKTRKSNVSIATVSDLENSWPDIEWLRLLTGLTEGSTRWRRNSKIAYNKDYIIKAGHLIRRTSKKYEILANYIMWKILEYFAPYLSKPIRKSYMFYMNIINAETIDRYQFCLDDTKSRFMLVSESATLRKARNASLLEAGRELVQSIKEELINRIETIAWLNNETKQFYAEKYRKLQEVIGVPDEIFNKYSYLLKLSFRFNNSIQLITELNKVNFHFKMKMIGKPFIVGLNERFLKKAAFNVFVTFDHPQIYLSETMLHSFIYDQNRPQYLNYGSLGGYIASELIQSFDIYLRNLTFHVKEKCYFESLSKFNIGKDDAFIVTNVNNPYLLGQDIAYSAYQNWVKKNGGEVGLGHLNYNPNQLFWIKASMNWCYSSSLGGDDDKLIKKILKYRIIEMVKHSPFWGNDFKCPQDSPMNPKEKCQIF